MSAYLVIVLPMLLGALMFQRMRLGIRALLFFLFLAGSMMLMLTGSKAGVIGLFASVLALSTAGAFRSRIRVGTALTCSFLAMAMGVTASGLGLFRIGKLDARISEVAFNLASDSRALPPFFQSNFETALTTMSHYPILGVGPGTFSSLEGPTRGYEVHNTFLSIGAEIGTPALLVFFVFCAAIGWRLIRAVWFWPVSSPAWYYSVVFLSSFIGCMLYNLFHNGLQNRLFWVLIGMIFGLSNSWRGDYLVIEFREHDSVGVQLKKGDER